MPLSTIIRNKSESSGNLLELKCKDVYFINKVNINPDLKTCARDLQLNGFELTGYFCKKNELREFHFKFLHRTCNKKGAQFI